MPIAPERNAAAYLDEIAPQLREFDKSYGEFWETPVGKAMDEDEGTGKLPTTEQIAALKVMLDALPEILPALAKASACQDYASLLDFKLPPRQFMEQNLGKQQLRSVARYVGLKMTVLVAEGDSEAAVRLGIQMLRLARLSKEPLLVNYLVGVAVRSIMLDSLNQALRRNQVSAPIRAELDAELALQDSRDPLEAALRSERAFSIPHAFEQIGGIPAFLRWGILNWMTSEMQAQDRACEAAKLTLDQLRPHWDPVRKQEEPPASLAAVMEGQLTGPFIAMVFQAEFRVLTVTRCLRVLNALGEYRDRNGKEAQRLDQLSLPAEAMTDPYSGQSLLIKKTDQGWVVYSVWANGVDDGGRLDRTDGDWGLAPAGYPKKQ